MASATWNLANELSYDNTRGVHFLRQATTESDVNYTVMNVYIRTVVPKYSRINNVEGYAEVDRNGLGLSSSNTDLKYWLSDTINSNGNNVFTFYNETGVIPNSYKGIIGTKSITDYIYSETANAGEAKGWKAWVITCSGTISHDYAVKNTQIIFDYTPPVYKIAVYSMANGVTGVGGTVTGGGTFDVTVADQTVTLTATPNEGYKFSYWADGGGAVGYEPTLNVVISQNNISAYETYKTYTAFFEKITYTITATAGEGGTVTGGGTYGYGETATLKASPNTGYKFVQWSDEVTTATRTVTVTGAGTYTAVFSPICVTYDSIFNFYRWKEKGVTSSRGTVSNVTDAGFTFTASIDDAYTDYSHMFKVESGKTYTFEYDFSGGNSHESFVFFHNAEGDYSWTKLASSTAAKWNFTVPDGYSLASVRFDVNTNGETITYSNIRIYPANCSFMSDTLSVSDRTDKAKWSVPTSTRDCYKFIGWNTKEDGSGTYYTASSTYPSEDLVLYSIWQADPPKISDVQVIYGGKVVSSTNKVPAGQSYIVKCKLE